MTSLADAPPRDSLFRYSCPFCEVEVLDGVALGAIGSPIAIFEAHLDDHFAKGTAQLKAGVVPASRETYLQNSDSLLVHRETCPTARPRPYQGEAWWFTPWPGQDGASRFDQACRRCLPDGLPRR